MFCSRHVLSLFLAAGLALFACSDDGSPVEGEEDLTPPALSSVTPVDESHVDVRFNEPVQRASAEYLPAYIITEGALLEASGKSPGDTLVVLTASLEPDRQTVALTTEQMEMVPYDLSVKGVSDLSGNSILTAQTSGFTGTNTPDTTPPQLVYRSPGPDATGVAVGMPIGLQFSEPVYLYGFAWSSDDGPVSHNLSTSDNVHFSVQQDQPLAPGTTYTVAITGVQDYAGNFMDDVTWSFTTAGSGDFTPPTVVSSVPANGATNVDINANLSLTFSEPIKQVEDEIVIEVYPFLGDGSMTFTNGGKTLVFDPDEPLLGGEYYTVTIPNGGVKDLAGNGIVGPVYITFTTAGIGQARYGIMHR